MLALSFARSGTLALAQAVDAADMSQALDGRALEVLGDALHA
ncbi:hypothetical protein AcdelDRAFT_0751 [Acidovorax delafieldii 2AN]|uniref:Uncharacterized protein n=1 Tax=Acidovorax delafieldii 2AN TaxID=573060 RepID=C5T1H1_ACIDE|nr:hypothetical protein [Acidovorax delafieldii]EER61639.1 hypothetical protein AcdelDRAFT_0751 [Acidovorax delafieldii 2AN]